MSGALSGLLACAVCYGSDDGALAQGAQAGVLVLAGVIVAVLGGIVLAIFTFRARAQRLERATGASLTPTRAADYKRAPLPNGS